MKVNYDPEKKTLRQWIKEGRVPNEDSEGEVLWTNSYCSRTARYYHADDTHVATKEELKIAKEPYLAKQREKAAKKREMARKLKAQQDLMAEAHAMPAVPCENPSRIVVFDVETTGLNPQVDEILQFSAIDGDGNTLLNTYVKPYLQTEWKRAAVIHGITPEKVQDAPYPHELIPVIKGIFESANLLISYNGSFDMNFLHYDWNVDVSGAEHFDVMIEFAEIYGEWNDYFGNWKWQKLTTCAHYYGYEFQAHDSLEDVRATLHCYRQMIDAPDPVSGSESLSHFPDPNI